MNLNLSGFKISDAAIASGSTPVIVRKVVEYLEKLPFKELIVGRQLAAAVGVSSGHIQHHGSEPILKDYRFKYKGCYLWGSKRTIKELARQNKES